MLPRAALVNKEFLKFCRYNTFLQLARVSLKEQLWRSRVRACIKIFRSTSDIVIITKKDSTAGMISENALGIYRRTCHTCICWYFIKSKGGK